MKTPDPKLVEEEARKRVEQILYRRAVEQRVREILNDVSWCVGTASASAAPDVARFDP